MKKLIHCFCILLLFIGHLHAKSFTTKLEEHFLRVRTELFVNIGYTFLESERGANIDRVEISQLGYDAKMGYIFDNDIIPYFLARGYKIFSSRHDLKSSSYMIGFGGMYVKENYELLADFSRSKENLLDVNKPDSFSNQEFINKLRVVWFKNFGNFKNKKTYFILGGGVNSARKNKIAKNNRGEYSILGLRIKVQDEIFILEDFIGELLWERDHLRTDTSNQIRNAILFNLGKRF